MWTTKTIWRQVTAYGKGRVIQGCQVEPVQNRMFCLVQSLSNNKLARIPIPPAPPSRFSKLTQLTSIRLASSATNCVGSIDPGNPPIPKPGLDSTKKEDIPTILLRILNFADYPKKVEKIMQKYTQFQYLDPEDAMKTWKFLGQKGVDVNCVRRMPWLLVMDKGAMEVEAKTLMSQLKIDEFRVAVPFLHLFPSSSHRLSRIGYSWSQEIRKIEELRLRKSDVKRKGIPNRIGIVAYWLNCEPYEVSVMMTRTPILMSTSLPLLESKIDAMLDNGISASDIIKDPFIFTNTLPTIESKLNLCKQNGLTTIKPWMLRCTPHAFNAYVERLNQEQQLLQGHQDITSFLSRTLKCTLKEAADISLRVPSLRNASASKLNEMIQCLLTRGFSREHILEMPRILGHSVETVEKRIDEMGTHLFTPNSLQILSYTNHQFNDFLRKMQLEVKEDKEQ